MLTFLKEVRVYSGVFFLDRIGEYGGVLDNDVKLVGRSLLRLAVDIGVSRDYFDSI